jgi:predicted RNA-binding protein with PUA-like domain
MRYWLLKSEPSVYSIQHLQRDRITLWDGVRNYQARNFLRAMQVNDLGFFYHSNTDPPGIVGLMRIVETGVVDPSQFDQESLYYDPKSSVAKPRWQTIKAEFVEEFPHMIPLQILKTHFTPEEFSVVRKGNRLSVMPVSDPIAQELLRLAQDPNGSSF